MLIHFLKKQLLPYRRLMDEINYINVAGIASFISRTNFLSILLDKIASVVLEQIEKLKLKCCILLSTSRSINVYNNKCLKSLIGDLKFKTSSSFWLNNNSCVRIMEMYDFCFLFLIFYNPVILFTI